MKKFYRSLPQDIVDILAVSNGWLIGSSISHVLDNKIPVDYDIIVPQDTYRTLFRYLNKNSPTFNNHGGLKVDINGISIDIWIQSLESYLLNVSNFTYAYNFNKNLLIKNDK